MLQRNIKSKTAKSIFYQDYNDIDIFIEDTADGYRKIYKELLQRVFGSEIKIDQVFPLGSKDEVIKECKHNQDYNDRKQLYIIDGDLLLFFNSFERINKLYILPRYCIENYLIDKTAIVDVIYDESKALEKNQIEECLKFEEWIYNNEDLIIELFKVYALCHKYIPQIQTVGFEVTKLCKDTSGILCREKTINRIEELKTTLISQIGELSFQQEYDDMTHIINQEEERMLKFVSGKSYLFPLILKRMSSLLDTKPHHFSLKLRISQKCDLKELSNIRDYFN